MWEALAHLPVEVFYGEQSSFFGTFLGTRDKALSMYPVCALGSRRTAQREHTSYTGSNPFKWGFFCCPPLERVLEPIMALNSKKQNKSSGVIVLLKGIDIITPSWAQYSLAAL